MKFLKQASVTILLVLVLVFPYFVFAESSGIMGNMNDVAGGYDTSKGSETGLAEIIGMIVSAGLSLLGVIFVILIIYAGFNWMTAAGDEGKIETAKKTLTRAIIGLIIIAGSYAIWQFIFDKLIYG